MTAAKRKLSELARNRRQTERFQLDRETTVILTAQGFRGIGCLEDLSYGGARLRIDGFVPQIRQPKAPIVIEHEALGRMCATPVWYRDRALGITFDRADSELSHALQCVALMMSPDLPDRPDLESEDPETKDAE